LLILSLPFEFFFGIWLCFLFKAKSATDISRKNKNGKAHRTLHGMDERVYWTLHGGGALVVADLAAAATTRDFSAADNTSSIACATFARIRETSSARACSTARR
jgi:hypothetical protein